MRIIFKCQKFSFRVLLSVCLIFCQFQSGSAYKSGNQKKKKNKKKKKKKKKKKTCVRLSVFVLFLMKRFHKNLLMMVFLQTALAALKQNLVLGL